MSGALSRSAAAVDLLYQAFPELPMVIETGKSVFFRQLLDLAKKDGFFDAGEPTGVKASP